MSVKSIFALAALAVLGASCLVATEASAYDTSIILQRNPGYAGRAASVGGLRGSGMPTGFAYRVSPGISRRYGRLAPGCYLPAPPPHPSWVQPQIPAIVCR
jgi:hypothetical protein